VVADIDGDGLGDLAGCNDILLRPELDATFFSAWSVVTIIQRNADNFQSIEPKENESCKA
jgi:hypothetical protein